METRLRTVTIVRCEKCRTIAKTSTPWETVPNTDLSTIRSKEVRQVLRCACGSQNWQFEELDAALAKPEFLVVGKMEVINDGQQSA